MSYKKPKMSKKLKFRINNEKYEFLKYEWCFRFNGWFNPDIKYNPDGTIYYNYFKINVRKPSFKIFVIILLFSMYGVGSLFVTIFKLIFS